MINDLTVDSRSRSGAARAGCNPLNTLEKMLFNVGLFKNFALLCVSWFNQRLGPKEQTTLGEVIKSWGGAYGAIALHPGETVERMWRREAAPGDLFPPPALGKHGITKSRFEKLRSLQALMFDKDETDMDHTDPWRYGHRDLERCYTTSIARCSSTRRGCSSSTRR